MRPNNSSTIKQGERFGHDGHPEWLGRPEDYQKVFKRLLEIVTAEAGHPLRDPDVLGMAIPGNAEGLVNGDTQV